MNIISILIQLSKTFVYGFWVAGLASDTQSQISHPSEEKEAKTHTST